MTCYNTNFNTYSLILFSRNPSFGDIWELACLLINLFFDLYLDCLFVYSIIWNLDERRAEDKLLLFLPTEMLVS